MGKCKCVYCGADFSGKFEYCPYCGEKVFYEDSESVVEQKTPEIKQSKTDNKVLGKKANVDESPIQKSDGDGGIDIEKLIFDYGAEANYIQDYEKSDILTGNIDELETINEFFENNKQTVDSESDSEEQLEQEELDFKIENSDGGSNAYFEQSEFESDNLIGDSEEFENSDVFSEQEKYVDENGEPVGEARDFRCDTSRIQKIIHESNLTNELKVFLTSATVLLPGLGQIFGVICAITFMNAKHDADRRSFGKALLVTSLIVFSLVCISCFTVSMFLTAVRNALM